LRAKLDEFEQREGGKISARTNRKPHLLLPSLNEVIRHPRILDAVEDVIGQNILCWGSGFFAKTVNNRVLVSWHQDSTDWGLSEPEVVTAWAAFTPSTVESG
jgi:ectoine hydroxylase-related dioxygenase (phytanoyl-CoA dioxygenase family)